MFLTALDALGMSYGNSMALPDWTYILVIIGALITMAASTKVKTTYSKYAKVAASCNLTGAQVAEKILRSQGINNVGVAHISGSLTDNYNPSKMTLFLSDSVYSDTSVASIGVAAHECGHAVQHHVGYGPLVLRSKLVPAANFGTKFGIPIILVGVILSYFQPLISLGIVLFSLGTLFQLVTLPVELDASRRALIILTDLGILSDKEALDSKKVLSAAAMTYVAGAASSLLQLLRVVLLFGGGRKRDRS